MGGYFNNDSKPPGWKHASCLSCVEEFAIFTLWLSASWTAAAPANVDSLQTSTAIDLAFRCSSWLQRPWPVPPKKSTTTFKCVRFAVKMFNRTPLKE